MGYLELGPGPYDENLVALGDENFEERAQRQCDAYVLMLKEMHPEGKFGVKWCDHDFGKYPEVVVYFKDADPKVVVDAQSDAEMLLAYDVEANLPANWTDKAKRYLAGNDNAFEQEEVTHIHMMVLLRTLGNILFGKRRIGAVCCFFPPIGEIPLEGTLIYYVYVNDNDDCPDWADKIGQVRLGFVNELG